jgi:hypothetical protein
MSTSEPSNCAVDDWTDLAVVAVGSTQPPQPQTTYAFSTVLASETPTSNNVLTEILNMQKRLEQRVVARLDSLDKRLEVIEERVDRCVSGLEHIQETMHQNDQRYRNYLLRTHQPFGFRPDEHHAASGVSEAAQPVAAAAALLPDGPGRFALSNIALSVLSRTPMRMQPNPMGSRRGGRR